jgi:hypothetical protein
VGLDATAKNKTPHRLTNLYPYGSEIEALDRLVERALKKKPKSVREELAEAAAAGA